jgi:methionyl aminopeptidase
MDQNEVENYLKAGEIAEKVRENARKSIKSGMPLLEIANKIESEIEKLGAFPAFPVNLSIDEIAAHYTPSSDDETEASGLLKIDIGVSVNGFVADTAFSLDLTPEKKHEEIIKKNVEVLENAISKLTKDSKVQDIGKAIQEKAKDSGFTVIKNLSGHSLDEDRIHAGITISNYENENTTPLEDNAFAIEPFLTTGAGEVYEGKPSEIFMFQSEIQVRDPEARKIIKFIKENYKTRPFCKRWLVKEGFKKLEFILPLLVKQDILHNFPTLVEKSKKPVSQAEHTILITDKVEVTTECK